MKYKLSAHNEEKIVLGFLKHWKTIVSNTSLTHFPSFLPPHPIILSGVSDSLLLPSVVYTPGWRGVQGFLKIATHMTQPSKN